MKPVRFVSAFSVFLVVILLMVLAAAQSTPLVDHRSGARAQVQGLRAGAMAQPVPAGQEPPIKFRKAVAYDSGGYAAWSVAIADVNGDGIPDLVAANACWSSSDCSGGSVGVLLGNGDGTFKAPVSYASGGFVYSVALGDVNGDGYPDVVVAGCPTTGCTGSYGVVGVLLNNGDGTFQPVVTYSSGGYAAQSVAIADVNGDGLADLLVANQCVSSGCSPDTEGSVGVLLGNGDGTFQAPLSYDSGGGGAFGVAAADLNGDGSPDIAVVNYYSATVGVLLNNGDGTFGAPVAYYTGGARPWPVRIADLAGDGVMDLIVPNSASGNVGVLLGNGDGTFQPALVYFVAWNGAYSVGIGDLNGDGYPDLAVAIICNCNTGKVSFLPGIGQGAFGPPVFGEGSGGISPLSVAVADLNGDGRPDVVVANGCANEDCNTSGSVAVLLNSLVLASTTTVVTSSLNPSQVGQSVTFTATVSSTRQVPDGGVVTFYMGKTEIGSGTTENGVATLTTSFSTAGNYTIKASYPGYDYLGASSGKMKQVVKK